MSWIFPGSNERSFISCRKRTQNLTLNRSKGQGKRKKLFSNSDGEDFTQHYIITTSANPLSMAQDVTFHEIVKFPNLQVQ